MPKRQRKKRRRKRRGRPPPVSSPNWSPPFPWSFKVLMKRLVLANMTSADSGPKQERYFLQFLTWLKALDDPEHGQWRVQRYCPNWMLNPWTPQNAIDYLKA